MKKLSPAQIGKMTRLAKAAMKNAYAPYSDHPVGAAILTSGGKMFAGANCEVAHYKGVCAEASAISAMITAGERDIAAVLVMGPGNEQLATPCGDCRQRIREFAALETPVYATYKNGKIGGVMTLAELLPYSFGPENMAEVGHGPKTNKKKRKK